MHKEVSINWSSLTNLPVSVIDWQVINFIQTQNYFTRIFELFWQKELFWQSVDAILKEVSVAETIVWC